MLKTIRNTRSTANSKKTKRKTGSDSMVVNSMVGNSVVGGGKFPNLRSPTKGKNQARTAKSKILVKSKNRDFPPNSKLNRIFLLSKLD